MKNIIKAFVAALCIVILTSCAQSHDSDNTANVVETSNQYNDDTSDVEFADGSHPRDDGYKASFNTKYKEFDNLALHIQSNIYTDETAQSVSELLISDYGEIEKVGSELADPVTIYIVQLTISGNPYVNGNELFCTLDDLESGEYRKYLIQVSFPISNLWQSLGLEWYIFESANTQDIDTSALKTYYDDPENQDALSLLPAYFSEDFSDSYEISIAYDTAYALTKYIINDYGLADYLDTSKLNQFRQKWVTQIGSTASFDEMAANLDDMGFAFLNSYPLVMYYDNFTFHFELTDWITNAGDVYDFLIDAVEGYPSMLSTLEADEPDAFAIIAERIEVPIDVYFIDSSSISHAGSSNKVYLSVGSLFYHEVVHVLVPESSNDNIWLSEGVATLLTLQTESDYMTAEDKKNFFECLTEEGIYFELEKEDIIFFDYVRNYYSDREPLPVSADGLDFALLYEAVGVTTLAYPEITTSLTMANRNVIEQREQLGNTGITAKDGNLFSYAKALVMTKYLSETYGLDTVISVVRGDIDFEIAFDGDFNTIFSEFMDQLENF